MDLPRCGLLCGWYPDDQVEEEDSDDDDDFLLRMADLERARCEPYALPLPAVAPVSASDPDTSRRDA